MERICPVCGSSNTSGVLNGKYTVTYPRRQRNATKRQNVYRAGCSCRDCGSVWREAYYDKDGETVNTDIEKYKLAKEDE